MPTNALAGGRACLTRAVGEEGSGGPLDPLLGQVRAGGPEAGVGRLTPAKHEIPFPISLPVYFSPSFFLGLPPVALLLWLSHGRRSGAPEKNPVQPIIPECLSIPSAQTCARFTYIPTTQTSLSFVTIPRRLGVSAEDLSLCGGVRESVLGGREVTMFAKVFLALFGTACLVVWYAFCVFMFVGGLSVQAISLIDEAGRTILMALACIGGMLPVALFLFTRTRP